jgi:hypothetical protein
LEVSVRKLQCKRDKKEKARVNYNKRTFMMCDSSDIKMIKPVRMRWARNVA